MLASPRLYLDIFLQISELTYLSINIADHADIQISPAIVA
jgi:hypothetical protein